MTAVDSSFLVNLLPSAALPSRIQAIAWSAMTAL